VIREPEAKHDPAELALRALAWTLAEGDRADRLLAITGMEAADLRARAGTRPVLAAVLGFLEAYPPDLVACADALEVHPERLAAARGRLEEGR